MKTTLLLAIIAALIGCGSDTSTINVDQWVEVSAEDLGEEWPFTVSTGRMACLHYDEDGYHPAHCAVFEAPDGTVYGLNGFGLVGHADPEPIRLHDLEMEKFGGTVWISIGPMIQAALDSCPHKDGHPVAK